MKSTHHSITRWHRLVVRCPIFLAICLVASLTQALEGKVKRPNILLIYSDDHGWADLGAQGVDTSIRTPQLDRLCQDGVRFTRGYVTAPQCVPSRAGVMTGRYQQRFGVEDNRHGPMPGDEVTLAERLKQAGYATGQVGKWHLDSAPTGGSKAMRMQTESMPHRQGFDEYWRGETRQYFASHDLMGKPLDGAPKAMSDTRFRIEVQTEAALSFLDRRAGQREQPWFLYLAWFAPHVPLESPEPWYSQTPANLPKERRQALAMIAAMDDGLGRIREKLRSMGEEEETLIFFIGDNGAPLDDAWNGSLNGPLVGKKGMLSEGGIRTPFIAAWPGTLPRGLVYEQPVISLDVAATANAAAGLPHDTKLDGVDLIPYLTGSRNGPPHETLYWRWISQSAVLEFPYKLLKLDRHEPMLFDITTPDGEHYERNLATKKPEVFERLMRRLETWSAQLQPPGLVSTESAAVSHYEEMYVAYHLLPPSTAAAEPKPPTKQGPADLKGWQARGATLEVQSDGLVYVPDPNGPERAKPFLTFNGLDLVGPVDATVEWKGASGGKLAWSWRTKAVKDFLPENHAETGVTEASQWQSIRVRMPAQGEIIHVRLTPPSGTERLEIRRIEMKDARGKVRIWNWVSCG